MKTALCMIALAVLAAPALGDTDITDDILVDTTWDLAGSPYVVHDYVKVQSCTLTIEPGVVVEFNGYTQLKGYYSGAIVAVGTLGNEILFTSHAATPAPDSWDSVYLFYSDESVFTHCIFEYGRYNLYVDRCSPTISSCTSRYGDSSGMACEDASPLIEHCNILDNSYGLRISGPNAAPEIHYSNICDNSSENLYVSQYDALPVTVINAENNWWGVDDGPGIEATFYISGSAQGFVEVDYDPWLHELPVDIATWSGIKAIFSD
ncbi:MAG: hypothetical protein JXA57_03325 [Armatimonadetes bacterium]|nr:hypothetical protein [Armatimonadota bacterium]